MRFGIMSMQIDSLVPSGVEAESVLTHIVSFDHTNLVRELAESGFSLIELGGDMSIFLPHTFSSPTMERMADLKTEKNLSYTVHLPLWSVEPSTPLSPVRRGSVDALIKIVEATRHLNPDAYVLHATGALAAEFYRMKIPEMARSVILRQFQSGARESVKTLLRETGIPSRKLAIETIEFPFELTLELAEELDLSICFDTGHVLVGFSGPVDFFEALERSLPRLGEIHLHDGPSYMKHQTIGYGEDHQALGKGDLDVGRLLDRLIAANYTGPVVFELRKNEALASLEYIRTLRPQILSL